MKWTTTAQRLVWTLILSECRQRDIPEYMRVPMESAHTCPVRSTSIQELIAVTRGFWLIIWAWFTKLMSHMTTHKHTHTHTDTDRQTDRHTWVHASAYGVSTHLSREINFNTRVDGSNSWVLIDYMNLIHKTDVTHDYTRAHTQSRLVLRAQTSTASTPLKTVTQPSTCRNTPPKWAVNSGHTSRTQPSGDSSGRYMQQRISLASNNNSENTMLTGISSIHVRRSNKLHTT